MPVDPTIPFTFRDASDLLSGTEWNGPNGTSLRYSMSVILDALGDSGKYAVQVGSPSIAPYDALQAGSHDRLIIQGFQEPQSSFAARQTQWLDRWPYSGRPTGVLVAAIGWTLPQVPQVAVVNNNSQWCFYSSLADPMPPGASSPAVPSVTLGSPTTGHGGHWNWDGRTDLWARSWLVLWASDIPWCSPGPNWGTGATWGGGLAWGFGQGPATFAGLPALVGQVKAAHCLYPTIIVSFSDTYFDPSHTDDGVHNPDGTWGDWYDIVSRQYVPSRFLNARFLQGAA